MAAEAESSALSVTLHPLVIINVSDHFTRNRCNTSGSTATRVFGILIGVQNGRQIEIANSFEVKVVPEGVPHFARARASAWSNRVALSHFRRPAQRSHGDRHAGCISSPKQTSAVCQHARADLPSPTRLSVVAGCGAPSGSVGPDLGSVRTRLEQYKKTFPKYEMLGWYSTAPSVVDGDLATHQGLSEVADAQLYLTLDPAVALSGTARELPISIYESELRVVDDKPTLQFAPVGFKMESIESERIAVDHIAHILPSGDSNATSAFPQHLTTQHTAISMLTERVDAITRYLRAVSDGTVAPDHDILRQVKSLVACLPALDTPSFHAESVRGFSDALLVAYLGCVTKGVGAVNDVVDKYNLAYDRHSRRRGIF